MRAGLPGGTSPEAIYYARSTDGGKSWSEPIKVAEGGVDWPRVAVPAQNQVYLVWQVRNTQPQTQTPYDLWGQSSPDAGAQWADAEPISGFGGVSGPADLLGDGAGRLYLLALGQGLKTDGVLIYSTWDGAAWSERETFPLGQPARQGNAVAAVVLPQASQLQVVLRAMRQTAGGALKASIMSMSRSIDSAAPVQVVPTFTPVPSSTPLPTSTPQATDTPLPKLASTGSPPLRDNGPLGNQLPLFIGGALAVVVLVGGSSLVIGFMRRTRR